MNYLLILSCTEIGTVNSDSSHFVSILNQRVVWTGIILPVIFLLLCALIKNFSGKDNKDQAIWLSMIAEVSIDIMSIMTTWIMTYFVLQNEGDKQNMAMVFVPLVISLILAFTHSMWRNNIIKDTKSSSPHYFWDWIFVILMIFISAGWLIAVINFYFRWIPLLS